MADEAGSLIESYGADDFALHCRGDVRLYCGHADCTPRSKKGRALLAVLAGEQRPLSRVKIVDLLWSDRQDEQARASLRTLLADLKSQFGERFDELLVVDRERIALGPTVRTDLAIPSLARPAGELFEGLDHIDPELDEWLRVERERWATITAKKASPQIGHPPARDQQGRRRIDVELWAIVLVVALALGFLLFSQSATRDQPMIAILKIDDLTKKNGYLADGLAEELRIGLSENPGIAVVGRRSSEDERIVSVGARKAAQMLGATHLVEGSILPEGRGLRLDLRLLDGRTGKVTWSGSARASGADVAMQSPRLTDQIADVVGHVVTKKLPTAAFRADGDAYAALFHARQLLDAPGVGADENEARQLLLETVQRYPNFVPALTSLTVATIRASEHPFHHGGLPITKARPEAISYARRALALAPEYGPAHVALAFAYRDTDEALPILKQAVIRSPNNYKAHFDLAWALERTGDFETARAHWRWAARLEPLRESPNVMLFRSLDNGGIDQDRRFLMQQYGARIEKPKQRLRLIGIDRYTKGDFSAALVSAHRMLQIDPEDRDPRSLIFNVTYTLFGPAKAARWVEPPDSISALLTRGDSAALVRKVESLGPEFFRLDFETVAAAQALGEAGRRDVLVRAYDQARASGQRLDSPDFGLVASDLILGLREAGRSEEGDQLLAVFAKQLAAARGLAPFYLAHDKARIAMLRGDRKRALDLLDLGFSKYWWGHSDFSSFYPAVRSPIFKPLWGERRFRLLRQRYDVNIARERNEAVKELKRIGVSV